jgi:hypothetical protein
MPTCFLHHNLFQEFSFNTFKSKNKKKHIEISLLSKELATLQIAMPPSAP